jgi:hypothetical protein
MQKDNARTESGAVQHGPKGTVGGSPGDYEFRLYAPSNQTPMGEQDWLLSEFEHVTDPHWLKVNEKYFQGLRLTIFGDGARLAVALHRGKVVGFSVKHRLLVDGSSIVYTSNLQIHPEHESTGIQGAFGDKS